MSCNVLENTVGLRLVMLEYTYNFSWLEKNMLLSCRFHSCGSTPSNIAASVGDPTIATTLLVRIQTASIANRRRHRSSVAITTHRRPTLRHDDHRPAMSHLRADEQVGRRYICFLFFFTSISHVQLIGMVRPWLEIFIWRTNQEGGQREGILNWENNALWAYSGWLSSILMEECLEQRFIGSRFFFFFCFFSILACRIYLWRGIGSRCRGQRVWDLPDILVLAYL